LRLAKQVFSVVSAGLITEAVRWGFGRHVYYLTPHQIMESVRYSYYVQPFAFLALVFGRVSFAISLIILIGIKPWRRWLLFFIIAGQFVINWIFIGILLGACSPAAKYWNRRLPGKCLDHRVIEYTGYVQGGERHNHRLVSSSH
jgi:hypothetical protein